MSELVSKEYLSKQFTGYSQVVKGQLDKKVNLDQGVDNKGKLLGINELGSVDLVDAPDSVKISAESDNQIEQKQDGIYVKDMSTKISSEENNAIISKEDGLYVSTVSETKISETEGNQIVSNDDGIYVAPADLSDYTKIDDVGELIENELYDIYTIPAHYEIANSTTSNALEVVADGTATDGQIDLSNVADIGASIGDFVIFVDETTTTDSKYAEKSSVYTRDEVDQKITDAQLGQEITFETEDIDFTTEY